MYSSQAPIVEKHSWHYHIFDIFINCYRMKSLLRLIDFCLTQIAAILSIFGSWEQEPHLQK